MSLWFKEVSAVRHFCRCWVSWPKAQTIQKLWVQLSEFKAHNLESTQCKKRSSTQKRARGRPLFVSVHMWLSVLLEWQSARGGVGTCGTFVNAFLWNEFHFTIERTASRLHAHKISFGSFTAAVQSLMTVIRWETFHMFTNLHWMFQKHEWNKLILVFFSFKTLIRCSVSSIIHYKGTVSKFKLDLQLDYINT